jgi:hypothetical protein
MLSLPDDETPLVAEGRIERADLIALLQLSAEAKAQIARYVRERNLLP